MMVIQLNYDTHLYVFPNNDGKNVENPSTDFQIWHNSVFNNENESRIPF